MFCPRYHLKGGRSSNYVMQERHNSKRDTEVLSLNVLLIMRRRICLKVATNKTCLHFIFSRQTYGYVFPPFCYIRS
eukprot:g17001.t1